MYNQLKLRVMIVAVWKDEDEDDAQFSTNGCGCCSSELSASKDMDEIISHLKGNLSVIKSACNVLGLDYNEFIK
jgi:hypothetical protein